MGFRWELTCVQCHTWEATVYVPGMFLGSGFPVYRAARPRPHRRNHRLLRRGHTPASHERTTHASRFGLHQRSAISRVRSITPLTSRCAPEPTPSVQYRRNQRRACCIGGGGSHHAGQQCPVRRRAPARTAHTPSSRSPVPRSRESRRLVTLAKAITGRQNLPTSPSAISSPGRSPSSTHPPSPSGSS